MTYRITFTSKAKLEFNEAAIWWAENRSAEQAARWLDRFQAAIETLVRDPERLPRARESHLFPFPLRQLIFGLGSKPTHRALFRVREHDVLIYGIRHLAQQDVSPEDLDPT